MKTRSLIAVLGLLAAVFSVSSIAIAAPKPPKESKEEAASEEHENRKNTTVVVLTATPEKVRAAALEALAAIGCKIKTDTAGHIEGKRSNKVGMVVGSGGERLLVWIKDLGDGKTELKVTTKKTMAGIVGQKLWNEEVASQIRDAVQ